MSFKNLFLTILTSISCYGGYNPEGFACTIDNAYNIMSIRLMNPPFYVYEWDGVKSEFADTKIYLKSFEYFIEWNDDNTINLKYLIALENGNYTVNFKNIQPLWDGPVSIQPHSYIITLSISDLFEKSVYDEFMVFGSLVRLQWYPFIKMIIEKAVNPFVGQKIFIDEYVLQ